MIYKQDVQKRLDTIGRDLGRVQGIYKNILAVFMGGGVPLAVYYTLLEATAQIFLNVQKLEFDLVRADRSEKQIQQGAKM